MVALRTLAPEREPTVLLPLAVDGVRKPPLLERRVLPRPRPLSGAVRTVEVALGGGRVAELAWERWDLPPDVLETRLTFAIDVLARTLEFVSVSESEDDSAGRATSGLLGCGLLRPE